MNKQGLRRGRTRFTSAPDDFTKPRISITHDATGLTFTAKGGRVNVRSSWAEQDLATFYIGDHTNVTYNTPTPTANQLRLAASKWLNANPEIVGGSHE